MVDRYAPEIVIGFVAPSGTDFDSVTTHVIGRLEHYEYTGIPIRLSDFLTQRAKEAGRLTDVLEADVAQRTRLLQAEGNRFRSEAGRNDALALAAVQEIVAARTVKNGGAGDAYRTEAPQVAYLVWSLKTPEEVQTLRAIYGSRFFLLSVHAQKDARHARLTDKIAAGHNRIGNPIPADRSAAEEIVEADQFEDRLEQYFGQNVRGAYPEADFFVDPDSRDTRPESIERAVDIMFGHPFLTPTRDEYGMFVANASALRSAELGRQVGAAVVTDLGDIAATGTNEVPIKGGGQYSAESDPDHREHKKGVDSSDELRARLAGQIAESLVSAGLVSGDADASLSAIKGALRSTRVRDLTEFGRALHAEASAFLDAARRGVSVRDQNMYVTTFPCHQCTRQIIASGLKRLVYIYPYPKSLAEQLHGDDIQVDTDVSDAKVPFVPFLGVAPRRYVQAFTMTKRKTDDGRAVPADDRARSPRLFEGDPEGVWEAGTYIVREQNALRIARTMFSTAATDGVGGA